MNVIEFFKRHAIRIGLSLAILLLFLLHVSGAVHMSFVQRMEHFAYDVRLNLMMPATQDRRIVIVDIDEKSLQEQGRWPWGRHRMADLVNILFDQHKIAVLGFDVVFAEKDESSGLKTLEALADGPLKGDANFRALVEAQRPALDYDQKFAAALKGRPVVLGYYFRPADGGMGVLPPPAFQAGSFRGKPIAFNVYAGFGANLPQLQQSAKAAGHFSLEPDADGAIRRIPMLVEYQGAYYESLSMAVSRLALGVPRAEAGFASGFGVGHRYAGLEWLQLGDRRIPVDAEVTALVPYRGRQGSFPYVSATDVLEHRVPVGNMEGAIVLVGTTAPGLMDLRATPVQRVFPGVEIHANMISGILDQTIKERPAYTVGAEFLMLLVAGLLLAFLLPALNPFWATAVTGLLLTFAFACNLMLWQGAHLVLPIASLFLMVLLIFIFNMSYGFFVESRGKRQLAGLFGQYVPPELVEEMARDPESFTLEGESREMTVLFSDVRGFTTISEGLDPKQLSQLMNEFLTPMTHVIHQHRGTIDKYMGDAIMAFWGAPLPDPEHARHALQAALGMIGRLEALRADFQARGWPTISIGVGLNTGLMTVGNMGSEFRMAYTVMGDAVNLGSRLEGLTKQYGVHIIVSEFTRDKVPDFLFRELDRVRVKGKDAPVGIYEPVCAESEATQEIRDELKLYREALKLYRAQQWDLAELQFLNLRKLSPERYLYQMYVERIAYFREHPPGEAWDGVFTFMTK